MRSLSNGQEQELKLRKFKKILNNGCARDISELSINDTEDSLLIENSFASDNLIRIYLWIQRSTNNLLCVLDKDFHHRKTF